MDAQLHLFLQVHLNQDIPSTGKGLREVLVDGELWNVALMMRTRMSTNNILRAQEHTFCVILHLQRHLQGFLVVDIPSNLSTQTLPA